MIAVKALLSHLARPEVTEVALASERNPCACVEGEYEPIGPTILSTDDILQMLFNAGGSRQVDALGPKPLQWTTRVEGVGPITVSAVMHGGILHARFSRRSRDTPAPSAVASRPADSGQPSAAPQRSSSLSGGARPSPTAAAPAREASAAVTFELDLDREDRKKTVQLPRVAPPATPVPPAPVELRGGTAIGRVTPLSALEPKGTAIGLVSPLPAAGSGRSGAAREGGAQLHGGAAETAPRPTRSAATVPARPAVSLHHDRLWKDLLLFARRALASDLHIIAERAPLVRVGGKLISQGDPTPRQVCEQMLLSRVPARLSPVLDREGSVDFAFEEPGLGRFRVNIGRQRTGLKASLRLIPAEIPTLASLGLPDAIGLATRHHQGLIVLTGPTGHGKTTTLAAIVDLLNRESTRHIITVEDPVEYVHPRKRAMMSQREVGTHTRSFQAALQAALREDPDVIVVGELRDTETVRMALSASETGHLVLGTMNTPSAAKTIDRLIDLFPPGEQAQVRVTLAGGLRLIVSQRLVPSPDEMRMVAAAEVLPGSVPLWNLIRDSKTFQIPSLQQRGKALGIVRLDDSLADLVRAGSITLPAALDVAELPDELEATLNAKRSAFPPDGTGRHSEGMLPPPRHDQEADEPAFPERLSDPFGDAPPSPPPGPGARGFLERASALFGKRGG